MSTPRERFESAPAPATPPQAPAALPRSEPRCGHTGRNQFKAITLLKMPGLQGNYTLSSITGGDRELTRHECPACRAHTMYVYRHIREDKTSCIGDDPEVVRAALHALLAQPGVDTFSMTVRDLSSRPGRDQVHYVIPRHHLPTFTIARSNSHLDRADPKVV